MFTVGLCFLQDSHMDCAPTISCPVLTCPESEQILLRDTCCKGKCCKACRGTTGNIIQCSCLYEVVIAITMHIVPSIILKEFLEIVKLTRPLQDFQNK